MAPHIRLRTIRDSQQTSGGYVAYGRHDHLQLQRAERWRELRGWKTSGFDKTSLRRQVDVREGIQPNDRFVDNYGH